MENNEDQSTYSSVPNRDNSFMLQRINTDELYLHLKVTLSGTREDIYQSENGEIISRPTILAKPLLNKEGQNYILNWFQGIVNSSTVQANLKDDVYWNTVASYREQIANFLFVNFNSWDVKEHTYDLIIESTLNTIKLFITRTIDNKERESYGEVYKETISTGNNKRGLRL